MKNTTKLEKHNNSVILTTIFFVLFFSSCGVAKQSQKQDEFNGYKIPVVKYTEQKSVSVTKDDKPLTKKDYAFIYRVFGNVKITENKNNSVQDSITTIENKNAVSNQDKLNKVFDDNNKNLSKQDSAVIYRIFGSFRGISR